jgi:hypothetical protein
MRDKFDSPVLPEAQVLRRRRDVRNPIPVRGRNEAFVTTSTPTRREIRLAENRQAAAQRKRRKRGRGATSLAYAPLAVMAVIGAFALSGNLPSISRADKLSAAEVVVKDSMDRTVTNGWGKAEVGGAYTVSLPSAVSVSNGTGTIRLASPGNSVSTILTNTRSLDAITRTTLSIPKLPTSGGGIYTSLLIRRQSNRDSYRAKVQILPGGELRLTFGRQVDGVETAVGRSVTLPFKLGAGQNLIVEAQAEGTSPVVLRSRAWLSSASAPSWNLTTQDTTTKAIDAAGAIGLMGYLSS